MTSIDMASNLASHFRRLADLVEKQGVDDFKCSHKRGTREATPEGARVVTHELTGEETIRVTWQRSRT